MFKNLRKTVLQPICNTQLPVKSDLYLDLELPVKSDQDPKKSFRIRHTGSAKTTVWVNFRK